MRTKLLLWASALAMLATATSQAFAVPDFPSLSLAPATPQTVTPPQSAEDKALAAVDEAGRQHVAALLAQLQAATQPETVRALERRIVEAKLLQRADFLRTKIRFATARGDNATADEAQRVLRALLDPASVAESPANVTGPVKDVPKGDAR